MVVADVSQRVLQHLEKHGVVSTTLDSVAVSRSSAHRRDGFRRGILRVHGELYDVGRLRLIALNYDWGCGYA